MQLLTVSPLVKGIPYEELTYFSKLEVSPGDLVEINIKKRICRALVLRVQGVEEERQSLKNASFVTKKISKIITPSFLNKKVWQALAYTSSYLLHPLGTLIYDLVSEKAFEVLKNVNTPKEERGFEILLLEQSHKNRILRYKTTIREMFSKKKSLVLFFPTIVDLEYAKEELGKGITEHVAVIHGGVTEKQFNDAMEKITTEEHPLLILSTPSLLPWVREDLGLVILEREHSHYYYTHGTASYDMRFVIETLARYTKIPCLLGSHMLSLRAHKMYMSKDASEVMPLLFRNDTNLSVVPMIEENRTSSPYLSKAALRLLEDCKRAQAGHVFMYAHRKGMYPTTICSDCGELFTCKKCNRPYVLHKISGVRTYVCHGCEDIVQLSPDSTLACVYCGGWRMTTLGIATGGVEEELQALGIPLFVIDGERTPTKAKVKKMYKEWCDSPFGVLIGTEMAHNVLTECDAAIIMSLDSLFSLPEYRTDEKILSLVTEMAEKVVSPQTTYKTFILQTRLKNTPVLKQLASPSFRDVYDTLLKERERFLLPPYYTVIKASFENLTEELRTRFQEELEPYTVYWFEQGKGITLLFIHIKESEWANSDEVRDKVRRVVYDASPLVNPLYFFIA
ncbi:MAG: hypothetical protein KBC21_00550 [Candidatus Pacebacteria bacterium]|nr:hypothetical protein [Candidatus Paceibacterota bacterium]